MAPPTDAAPSPGRALEDFLAGVGAEVSRERVEALRHAVLQDVEARVAEKTEEIWRRGQGLLEKMQKKHSEEMIKLSAQAVQTQQRLQALEVENNALRASVADVGEKLDALSRAVGAVRAPAASPERSWASPVVPRDCAEHPLPELPPFPMQPGPGAGAISLADALTTSSPAPPRKVVTLSDSITPPPSPSRKSFSFTLRKADGLSLGLNVSHSDLTSGLLVEGVRPDGAVEAWNKICAGSGASADRGVRDGDKIVAVNGIRDDPAQMLAECQASQTVKLTVVRGEPREPKGAEEPPADNSGTVATTMRADASVFVPMSSAVNAADAVDTAAPKAQAAPAAATAASPREEVAPEATPEVGEVA